MKSCEINDQHSTHLHLKEIETMKRIRNKKKEPIPSGGSPNRERIDRTFSATTGGSPPSLQKQIFESFLLLVGEKKNIQTSQRYLILASESSPIRSC